MTWHLACPSALGADECAALMAVAEAAGFAPARASGAWIHDPSGYAGLDGRDQDRAAVHDEALASLLWGRLGHLLRDRAPGALGLNPRLRFYAYRAGQSFGPHQDGRYVAGAALSRLTLLLYLNDGFEGGETEFLDDGALVQPTAGGALWFPHARWHAGRPVRAGRKVVLRTDVMFPG